MIEAINTCLTMTLKHNGDNVDLIGNVRNHGDRVFFLERLLAYMTLKEAIASVHLITDKDFMLDWVYFKKIWSVL